MSSFTKINLADVKDVAPDFGMDVLGEARFAREVLGAQRIGMAHYRVKPGQRAGFGHKHGDVEEIYVVLKGSGRFKVEDDILDVGAHDVIYCPPEVMRAWEAGSDGLEMIAFGAHVHGDGEIEQGWWAD
jgi:mannose-6-phosphate isomerase-like protein (cupin superfamily)